ncbi:MarR family transcriptional regulator [Vibrio parahaemolyticus]|uniref:MarR family transcriptional regulator n=1 Tax=Vibrio parahaemolyticus TaxID=670 RepID=UPI0015DF3D1C|nr:helix-turn-helix domain-containing protein [Vibrio parahaemolyticus]
MLGLIDRKALKNATIALYHELVRGRLCEGNHFGLSVDDISKRTGLNVQSAMALIHRLIDSELLEKYGFKEDVSYRAANIPIHLDKASTPIRIFQYVNRAIGRVDFKGIA